MTSPAAAITLPPDYLVEDAVPGVTWNTPVNLAFLPDGRMLVAEKRGVVWVVKDGVRHPSPVWSGEAEVLNHHDRGLLGIAVDPAYATNRRLYFLYTVDADSNGSDGDEDAFGRLTRYRMSAADSNAVDPASRAVLLGVDWPNGPLSSSPSHTVGTIQFGEDGSLLLTAGDGAQFAGVDSGGRDPAAFGPGRTNPLEDIGAYRAQYLSSLAGKMLRLDPATGLGYPSNPYWDGNPASVASRVWAYGARNAYRFCVRPGTGSADPADGDPGAVYIGDVGWNRYEEINVAHGGENFGWPCYEGLGPNSLYQSATPAHHDCSTIGTASNPAFHTPPVIAWHHSNPSLSTPPGIEGQTATGGVFCTSNRYPPDCRGRYFFADYTDDWIRTAAFDTSDALVDVQDFAFTAGGPVAFALNPVDGWIYYVAILDGEIRRIRYTGALPNTPPMADLYAPCDSTFFAAGDTVWMHVAGSDAEEAPGALIYRLEADLHHDGHIHANSAVIDDSTGFFVVENHEDNIGVWFELRGIVTDGGGMRDTSVVSILPEVDLSPGGFSANVPQLGTDDTATFTFRIHNLGAMPSPPFRWRFSADGAQLLAEGDTLVGARDSVTIVRTLPPSLSAGAHVLRITADTLGAVAETRETNNAFAGTIVVVEGSSTVAVGDAPVGDLSLGNAFPNPASGVVGFALALPRASDVSFAVLDVQGREVWRAPEQALPAGRTHLWWTGATGGGGRARPGLYLAKVRAGGVTMVRRFVVLK